MKQIGDFVETVHGVNGILIGIRKCGYCEDVAFIATSDMKTFGCPINDIKEWAGTQPRKEDEGNEKKKG